MRSAEPERHFPSRVPLASVRSDRDDWHVVHVSVVDLSDVHWDEAAKPSRHTTEQGPTLYGFTTCDAVIGGELPHDASSHGHPPHVRDCILKDDNDREVFERLVLEAGPRPRPHSPDRG